MFIWKSKTKLIPQRGALRTVTRFAFTPTEIIIDGEKYTVWLKFYYCTQQLVLVTSFTGSKLEWRDSHHWLGVRSLMVRK